jgi:ribosomal protein L6P/L9E
MMLRNVAPDSQKMPPVSLPAGVKVTIEDYLVNIYNFRGQLQYKIGTRCYWLQASHLSSYTCTVFVSYANVM